MKKCPKSGYWISVLRFNVARNCGHEWFEFRNTRNKKIVQNVYGEFPTITHTFVRKSSSYVCRRLSDTVGTIAYFVYILFRQNVRAVNSTRGFALLYTFQWLTWHLPLFFIVGLSRGPSTLVCRVANKARTIRLCTLPTFFYFPCAHIIPNSFVWSLLLHQYNLAVYNWWRYLIINSY